MMDQGFLERSIFEAAIDKGSPQERAAYLDQACGSNAALRQEVEALLAAHDRLGRVDPAARAPSPVVTVEEAARSEHPGTVIGAYKLLEQIGEGGFGVVFMAEQTQPVRRKVALKVLKPGMDSRQVVARFEAERQALALMDHPNIAHVFDGGEAASGRPYFVMELVRGIPLTEFCDQNHLSVRQRLELFVPVCQAVQHAHQKGVIHRDLKPSNILVTLHDGTPVAKVIDFGIAKAMGQQLTDKTLFTGFAQMIGTPLYMSPEQAEMSGLDIDTRSDIYSLGVLLYELLTGTTPFDKERLRTAAYDEIRRIIREEEPARPSTRISTLGQAGATVSANRNSDPKRLSQLFRGELDWIVMKALEKDRNRRYETASAFAADVARYLHDEPVLACPPSAGYRLRKFVRRYRGPVWAASLVLLALVVGIIGTTWGLIRTTDAQAKTLNEAKQKEEALKDKDAALARATASAQDAKTKAGLAKEAQQEAVENLKDALAAVDKMLTRVAQERLANVPQMEPIRRELLQDALTFYQKFLAKNSDDAVVRRETAWAYRRLADLHRTLGQYPEAAKGYRKAFALFEELDAQAPLEPSTRGDLVSAHLELAGTLLQLGKREEFAKHSRRATQIAEDLVKEFPNEPSYCDVLVGANNHLVHPLITGPEEAEKILRRNLTLTQTADLVANIYSQLGHLAARQERYPEAEKAYQQSLTRWEKLASEQPTATWLQASLGGALLHLANAVAVNGRPQEAEALCCRAIALLDKAATDYPGFDGYRAHQAGAYYQQAGLLKKLNRMADAEKGYHRAADLYAKMAADFPSTPAWQQAAFDKRLDLGQLLVQAGRVEEAQKAYGDAITLSDKLAADLPTRLLHWQGLVHTHIELGRLLATAGKTQEARAAYQQAIQHLEKLVGDFPDTPGYRALLAGTYNHLRLLLAASGKPQEAAKAFDNALRVLAGFPAERATTPADRATLSDLHFRRGDMLRSAKRLEEAKAAYRQAIEGQTKLAADFPKERSYRHELGRYQNWLGIVLSQMGQRQQAEQGFRRAFSIYEKLIAETELSASHWHRRELAWTCLHLGRLLKTSGRNKEAENVCREGLAQCEKLAAEHPSDGMYPSLIAQFASEVGQFAQAEKAYRKLLELDPNNAMLHNNLAWLLATCPDPKFRDAGRAVELAKKAAALAATDGTCWNTLGVAHYRAGAWKEAVASLTKSMGLRQGGDSFDWFFLGMAHWKLGHKEEARKWHDKAAHWMEKNAPQDEELRRFRAEAVDLLGIKSGR